MAIKKQYVNLDPGVPAQLKGVAPERAGRVIEIVARLKQKRKGVPIVFEITSGPNNKVRSLARGNFDPKEYARLAGATAPAKTKRRAWTNDAGRADMLFILSAYGGDEFQVRAWIDRKDGAMLVSDTYVVWKRFYYQVSRFTAGAQHASRGGAALPAIPALAMGNVKTEFEARNHNIEIVKDTCTDLIARRGEVLEGAGLPVTQSASDSYTRTREPVSLRMVLVRQIATSATVQRTFADFTEGVTKQIDLGARPWLDESLPLNTDWLVTAEWAWTSGDLLGGWKPLAGFNHFQVAGGRLVDVTFPVMPARWVYNDRNLQLRLTYRYLAGSTNGMSWYNAVWIANENMHAGARTVPEKEQTTIHEIGHFLELVPAAQSTHYVAHDHQGPHCSTGLSAADKTLPGYGGLNGTCVMFGENAATRTGNFCAVCDPSVRAASVILDRMPAGW